jgi:hypothetical protein
MGCQTAAQNPNGMPNSGTKSQWDAKQRHKIPMGCQTAAQNKTKQNKTKQNKTKQNKTFYRLLFILSIHCIIVNPLISQIIIRDSIVIKTENTSLLKNPGNHLNTVQYYSITYDFSIAAIRTPRPRVILSNENNIDTIAYCWLVSGCTGAGGNYTNQYRPWYTTDTSAAISLVYTEGEDQNGNVVPYPTVEIAQISTFQGDVKTFQVILHYPTPYWNPPTDPVFGYIRFKMSTVPPPKITVYLNGSAPTGETNYYISRNYTPVLTLTETHSASFGSEPVITWYCPTTINTADFIDTANNSLTVPASAATYAELFPGDPAMVELIIRASAENEFGISEAGFPVILQLMNDTLHHFLLTAENDTVAYSEETTLIVTAKNQQNTTYSLNDNTLLNFTITDSIRHGTFIINSDTVTTVPPVLTNVTYGDARTGKVRFAAITKNPANAVPVTVRVSMQSDQSKQGEAVIPVVEQSLTIVMELPYEVRPSIPTEDRNTALTALRRKPFQVRMTRNHAAVPNHAIRLYTDYVVGSGGHVHNQNNFRRPDHHDNYGYFTFNNPNLKFRPLDTITNTNGIINVNYNASIFGDSMKIIVTSVDSSMKKYLCDTVAILEKVNGLELLPVSGNYNKIGGTANHYGPPGHPNTDNNHWGLNWVNQRIANIALAFQNRCPNEELLQINDMSLPLGGKFDIGGEWIGSHETHRNGRNVDIQSRLMEGDRFNDVNRDDEYNADSGDILLSDINGNGLYDGETMEIFREIAISFNVSSIRLEYPFKYAGSQREHWHLTY